jgi:hypothetical protein
MRNESEDKLLNLVGGIYVAAAITVGLLLHARDVERCNVRPPIAYVLVGAAWPATGFTFLGAALFSWETTAGLCGKGKP